MSTIQKRERRTPLNVRLPESLLQEIRGQAEKSERTLSGQVRWLLLKALSCPEGQIRCEG